MSLCQCFSNYTSWKSFRVLAESPHYSLEEGWEPNKYSKSSTLTLPRAALPFHHLDKGMESQLASEEMFCIKICDNPEPHISKGTFSRAYDGFVVLHQDPLGPPSFSVITETTLLLRA